MLNLKDILKKYIERLLSGVDLEGSEQKISFFILSGVQDSGKLQIAQELSKDILGQLFENDFLYIKDFSTQLKKPHSIKVAEEHKETYKVLLNEYNYKDIGTREINIRLQQSPAGKTKILLIENIERMTPGAINAFLKSCEEPLPNRIIIATTANKSQILDTVISRAIVIDTHQDRSEKLEGETNDLNLDKDIAAITKVLATKTNIHNKHKLLSEINKKGLIKPFLDELIAYYISRNDFKNSDKRLNIKKMSKSNVSMDNLLFYALLG